MKSKRLLCALFALMLVGASVTNAVAVFADESAETGEGVGEVINTNEEQSEVSEGEGENEAVISTDSVDGAVGADKIDGTDVVEEVNETVDSPVITNDAPVLMAAPTANEPTGADNNEVLLRAAPTMENYDYEMALSDSTKTLEGVSDAWMYDYRCSVVPASGSGGMTCIIRSDGSVVVNASRAGEYTITIIRRSIFNIFGSYTTYREDTVAVYNLDATVPTGTFHETGEELSYSINDANTFGEVETTVTFTTPDGAATTTVTDGTTDGPVAIDTSSEGEYTISIVDTSYPSQTKEAHFFVVAPVTEENYLVSLDEAVELTSDGAWSADYGWHVYDRYIGEDGTVSIDASELGTGVNRIVLTHDFGNYGERVVKTAWVIVYDIYALDGTYPDEDYTNSAETLINILKEMTKTGSWADVWEKELVVFGDDEEGQSVADTFQFATMVGLSIATGANVEELDEADVDEALVAKMAELGATNVKYYDVTVLMNGVWHNENDEEELFPFGQMHQLDGQIVIAIPYDTTGEPEEGYQRVYYVVRMHNGEVYELTNGVDFYVKDGVIYIRADMFSQYAVGYNDVLIPVEDVDTPNTGVATAGDASASASMAVTVAMAVAMALAGVAVVCKRR